jgi:nitroreductase
MPVNQPDHPINESLANRWSPYRFEPREVEDHKILSCLEAARWAASSFNDQPWSWIVARRQDTNPFEQMLTCLLEANRIWASNAGALILTVTRSTFRYNGKPNRVALHDLGVAAAQLTLQAGELGLHVHQMAGVNLSLIRQLYGIPAGFEPQTAIAIGYADLSQPADELAKQLHQRETGPREREPLSNQVFAEKWGEQADFVS